jgi:hypothetical protein
VRDIAPTALRAGFLTPCRDRLPTAVSLQLFARTDVDFLEFFAGAAMTERLEAELATTTDKVGRCRLTL